MKNGVQIRVSGEMRDFLGDMRLNKRETYDMLLRRKLMQKRSRKVNLKNKMFPNLTPGKATRKVLKSDNFATKLFLETP